MIMRLLIVAGDRDYVEHLSGVLAEKYSDTFEVHVCSSVDMLREIFTGRKFDVALIEPAFVGEASLSGIKLSLILRSADDRTPVPEKLDGVAKYQRVSSIVREILDKYARANPDMDMGGGEARLTAVWSPRGGSGKTAVALACAAGKVAAGKKVAYFSLQPFSDGAAYFQQTGKSVSTIFGENGGSLGLLAQSIRLQDRGSGILYFCDPTNYDDICELTGGDIEALLKGLTYGTDELVVDLPSEWNEKISRVFDMADTVMAVIDRKHDPKWEQFSSQHNVYERIKDKLVTVANKGASTEEISAATALPRVPSENPVVVYKTLSAYFK